MTNFIRQLSDKKKGNACGMYIYNTHTRIHIQIFKYLRIVTIVFVYLDVHGLIAASR